MTLYGFSQGDGIMSSYTFSGRITPERTDVRLSSTKLKFLIDSIHKPIEMIFSIGSSQISAVLTTQEDDIDVGYLKNIVQSIIQSHVDCLAFTYNYSWFVEIDTCVDSLGNQKVFGVYLEGLERRLESDKHNQEYYEIVEGVFRTKSPIFKNQLRNALADYRLAIKFPNSTAFHCYRSIESIKNAFDPDDDKNAWKLLRENLKISEAYIRLIKDDADLLRHGKPAPCPHAKALEYMQHCREIVDRAIQFASSGKTDFPQL